MIAYKIVNLNRKSGFLPYRSKLSLVYNKGQTIESPTIDGIFCFSTLESAQIYKGWSDDLQIIKVRGHDKIKSKLKVVLDPLAITKKGFYKGLMTFGVKEFISKKDKYGVDDLWGILIFMPTNTVRFKKVTVLN